MTTADSNNTTSIKEKFEREIYLLDYIPRILEMDVTGVYMNKNGPYPDEVEALEHKNWSKHKVSTLKLRASSYGDWEFSIEMINTKHFESREELDDLYVKEYERITSSRCIKVDIISIQKAVKLFHIDFSCNMDWYLNNQNAIEENLNRRVLPRQ
ncbi:unnamed protein product [Adineta ricciae]|uniref:Uncharacterized protein n=1 Tax=Adineta ricciae TaxID=249248 RepID=A0A814W3G7_ADIRI|nr:unnamed protein product [Adineta ricciae]CAF1476099.1 unnamed protein product [Adineta ricciae]